MLAKWIASAVAATAVVVAFGCSDNTNTTCTPYQYAGTGAGQPANDYQCVNAGGTCNGACPNGTHPAPSGSGLENACNNYYPYDPAPNGCYATGAPQSGAGIANMQCCLPNDGGADADASDAPTDGRGDAHDAAQTGSCAGTPCAAGCSCEILPQTQRPYCACVDGGASDAAIPNCGSIWCFGGCTCTDANQSACSCP